MMLIPVLMLVPVLNTRTDACVIADSGAEASDDAMLLPVLMPELMPVLI